MSKLVLKKDAEGKEVALSKMARDQFEEWQTHAPTKDLKSADGTGIVYLRIGDIRPDPKVDSRGEMTLVVCDADSGSDSKSLTTIPDVGLINPPRVTYDKIGAHTGWHVTAGNRRLQYLGSIFDPSTIIMCTLATGSRLDQAMVSLAENVGRQQLTVPALADALYRIREIGKMPHQDLAMRTGFSPSHVSNLLTVRSYLTDVETNKWRLAPKSIDLKSAISRIKQAKEEAIKAGKKPEQAAHVDLFETGSGGEQAAPEEKERRKRANKVQSIIRDHGMPNHVIGLEQAMLSPSQQLDLIMRGYYLAMGEEDGIVLEKLASGDVVASVLQKKDAPPPANGSQTKAAEAQK